MINGEIIKSGVDHFYVSHNFITYDVEALKKFGTRLDYQPNIPILNAPDAADRLGAYFDAFNSIEGGKTHLGGKNVGGFDKNFLLSLHPGLERSFRHRFVDIGNLYHRPSDKVLPDLAECRNRAAHLLPADSPEVTHTALDDAMVAALLYQIWYNGGVKW